jgi:SAM-dependent methyltransferase
MNKQEIQNTIERYNQRLKEHGVSEKALGWGDKGRSKLRFEILCSEWDFENATVIDYGCGFGDLYAYIANTRTSNFKYIGIDLNPSIIDIAKSRNYTNASFYVASEKPEELLNEIGDVDFILSSGIFNFKVEDNIGYIENTLKLFNEHCNKGFASNFLSNKVDFAAPSNYHSNPAEILNLHYRFGNNVILKNNYMPFEFTVFVNKEDGINKDLNVYESFVPFV